MLKPKHKEWLDKWLQRPGAYASTWELLKNLGLPSLVVAALMYGWTTVVRGIEPLHRLGWGIWVLLALALTIVTVPTVASVAWLLRYLGWGTRREPLPRSEADVDRAENGPKIKFGSPAQRAKYDLESFWHIPVKPDTASRNAPRSYPDCKVFLDRYESGAIKEKLRMCWGDMTFESPRDFAELVEGRVTLVPVAWRTESGDDRRGFFADARFAKDRRDRTSAIPSNHRKYRFRLRVVGRNFEVESPHFYLVRCPKIRSNGHFVVEMEYEGEGTQGGEDALLDAVQSHTGCSETAGNVPAAIAVAAESPALPSQQYYSRAERDRILDAMDRISRLLNDQGVRARDAAQLLLRQWDTVLLNEGEPALRTRVKRARLLVEELADKVVQLDSEHELLRAHVGSVLVSASFAGNYFEASDKFRDAIQKLPPTIDSRMLDYLLPMRDRLQVAVDGLQQWMTDTYTRKEAKTKEVRAWTYPL
jgi:hypothetical protein